MAVVLSDLLVVGRLSVAHGTDKEPEDEDFWYGVRAVASHSREAADFVDSARRRHAPVEAFVRSVPGSSSDLGVVRQIQGNSTPLARRAERMRNAFWHYPETFPDHMARADDRTRKALQWLADQHGELVQGVMGEVRAEFAVALAAQIIRLDDDPPRPAEGRDPILDELVSAIRDAGLAMTRFAISCVRAQLESLPPGTVASGE